MKHFPSMLLVVGLWAAFTRSVAADDPPSIETERAAEAAAIVLDEARAYILESESLSGRAELRLEPRPLLQWSNPVAGSIHGSVFVWTDRGRPEVIGSLYKWSSPNKHLGVELHALGTGRVSGDRNGRPIWKPTRTGPDREPIPGAPVPGPTPTARLRQMRALAKSFSATETTRAAVGRELRLLPQPLYRYESTDPEVVDGGLFAFVEGTDPEIVLLIEARRGADGPRWHFAAARLNSCVLDMKYEGRPAWSAPEIPWNQARDHGEPYSLFIYQPDPGMGAGDDAPAPR